MNEPHDVEEVGSAEPGSPPVHGADAANAQPDSPPRRRGWLGGIVRMMRDSARDVISLATGKPSAEDNDAAPAVDDAADRLNAEEPRARQRVGMLHRVAEQLRGAADSYVAAKLDEIEARVDQKLDQIEERINHKLVDLHRQLGEWRDQELRHRLRILKLTLIFTVLVALLSLGYNWVRKYWV